MTSWAHTGYSVRYLKQFGYIKQRKIRNGKVHRHKKSLFISNESHSVTIRGVLDYILKNTQYKQFPQKKKDKGERQNEKKTGKREVEKKKKRDKGERQNEKKTGKREVEKRRRRKGTKEKDRMRRRQERGKWKRGEEEKGWKEFKKKKRECDREKRKEECDREKRKEEKR